MTRAQIIHTAESVALAIVGALLAFDWTGAHVGALAVAIIMIIGRQLQVWLVKAQTPPATP